MYLYFLIILIAAATSFSNGLLKKFQAETEENFVTLCVYNFYNALVSSVYFLIANGFVINMNVPTFIYSVAYAVIVAGNLIFSVVLMARVNLVVVSIITTAGSIIGTSAFGVAFLNESIGISLAMAILLILVSSALPFIGNSNSETSTRKSNNFTNILLSVLLFLFSGANVVINKLYVGNEYVCDNNSYFFMLNIILLAVCVFALAWYCFKKKDGIGTVVLRTIPVKHIANIGIRTIANNIGVMITMIVLTQMNVSLYTVLSMSLALVGNTIISKFWFKERMTVRNMISLALAIGAIILAR